MLLADLIAGYRPSSFDPPWTWDDEIRWMITTQPGYLAAVALDIASRGILTPIQVHHGERRVWDGHHRVVIAILLGLETVPVADARYSDTNRLVEETTPMKNRIAAVALLAGIALGAVGCDLTAISTCSNTKPVSGISLRGAQVAYGYATCDGVTNTSHYAWHIRLSDGKRTYLKITPL